MKSEPVFIVPVPNIVKIIQGDRVILIRPEDADALAVSLRHAAENAVEMGKASK